MSVLSLKALQNSYRKSTITKETINLPRKSNLTALTNNAQYVLHPKYGRGFIRSLFFEELHFLQKSTVRPTHIPLQPRTTWGECLGWQQNKSMCKEDPFGIWSTTRGTSEKTRFATTCGERRGWWDNALRLYVPFIYFYFYFLWNNIHNKITN